jgi:hypothetical protein
MLSINQKRSLGITLGIVEDEMRRLQDLLEKGEQHHIFSHIADDLKAPEKEFLRERMQCLLETLGFLKSTFDLRHSHKELVLSSLIKSTLLYLIVELEQVFSDQLKGYGPVASKLKETLDPELEKIISILHEMSAQI